MAGYLILSDREEIEKELRDLFQNESLYRIEDEMVVGGLIVQGLAQSVPEVQKASEESSGLAPAWMVQNVPRDWMIYFNQGKLEEFCQSAENFFQQAESMDVVDVDFLSRFQQDLIQELGFALKTAGVPLSHLLKGSDSTAEMRKATLSVPNMLKWLREIVQQAMELTGVSRETHDLIPRVLDYIQMNLERHITREELSEHFHLSKSHIARRFREKMGMSISTYINQQRIEKACLLLRESEIAPGAVAVQCGYNDYPYFFRTFKKLMGCSPTEYQMKHKNHQKDKTENPNKV